MKQVNRPSDDPLKVSKILDLKNEIKQNQQYKRTISDSIDFTNVQDSALDSMTLSLQRIYTLTLQAANGSNSTADRQAIKVEIMSEVETMVDSLNTNFGGRYIFGGQASSDKPFSVNKENGGFELVFNKPDGAPNGNVSREISRGVMVELQTDGAMLFNAFTDGEGNVQNLNDLFSDLFQALDSDDTEALGGRLLTGLDKAINNTVNQRTNIGAIQNRLIAARNRNEAEFLNLETIRSTTEDIDLAETFMKYSMQMVSYQASLNMGTRILQTNILDYVR